MKNNPYSSVILVNPHDHPSGIMDKMEAHRRGLLHRAVSVFIFDSQGRWLLQRRAIGKYHSGGLWSNACCTHPIPAETLETAIQRRLKEELGISCPIEKTFEFIYHTQLDHGMTEYEYDHVFKGYSDDIPDPDPAEADDWKYVSPELLKTDIQEHPERYTAWFQKIYRRFL